MSAISSILPSLVSQGLAQQNQAASASSASFGPAVNVDLSPAAQSAANGQPAPSGPPPATGAKPAAPAGHSAPVGGVSSGSSSSGLASLIAFTKQQVAEKVGPADANLVVDQSGNIDSTLLAKFIREQQLAA